MKIHSTIKNYTGPKTTASEYDPKAARLLKPANKLLVKAWMHTDIEGVENIPKSGGHMICFNHESMSDASLVQSLTDGDYRFVAAKEQFVGPVGKAMTALGAIPVDRDRPGREIIDVTTGLMNEGVGIAIAPEGGIRADGKINSFKEGPAKMALESDCESLVPVVLDYSAHPVSLGNRVGTYLVAGAVAVGSLAAAFAGGATAQSVAGAVTGVLAGTAIGGAAGYFTSKKDGTAKVGDALKGAALGGVALGLGGGFGADALGSNAPYLLAPLGVVGGATALAGAKLFNERKDARVVVGEGIPVEPYRQMEDQQVARKELTRDLRARMMELHQGIRPDLKYDFTADPIDGSGGVGGEPGNWDEMTNAEKITHLVARQLRLETDQIKPDATFTELGADSLDNVEMVLALEKAFDVKIPDEIVAQLQTVADVMKYIEEQTAKGD